MKNLIIAFALICLTGKLIAQQNNPPVDGKVSYISSQNVYVKFVSTENFKIGDTLFIQKEKENIPVLVVNNLSSTSCVCTPISKEKLSVSMQINAKTKIPKQNKEIKSEMIPIVKKNAIDSIEPSEEKKVIKPEFEQKISGSISASSYSNFSSTSDFNSTRFRYQLSLNARNIANSKFSAETNITFQHQKDQWNLVQENINKALKIYNLSVKYDNNKNTMLVLGRKFNPKISSMGAIDGLQYVGKANHIFWGAIAGSRPNYADYSFDFSLLQFGAYAGHTYSNSNGVMENSFALVEQMNTMHTDRRFAYFQHSNTLAKNLYFFGTAEIDLYKNIDSLPQNTFDLTSAYLVLNYKIFKRITLSTSYDNRKNIIYYETYKSYINQLLEIESRQGLNLGASYYDLKNLSFGFKTGYRFANSNSKETINLYGFVSYYNVPVVKLNATASANYLQTSYVNGQIFNLNITRDILKGDLFLDLVYQFVDYSYVGTETTAIQNVINLSISWRFLKNTSLTVNYEQTFEKQERYSRLNLQIRKRF